MTEFTITIEDDLVASLGEAAIEQSLHRFVERLNLKAAAEGSLHELQSIDLENDPQWQLAREEAWKESQRQR